MPDRVTTLLAVFPAAYSIEQNLMPNVEGFFLQLGMTRPQAIAATEVEAESCKMFWERKVCWE